MSIRCRDLTYTDEIRAPSSTKTLTLLALHAGLSTAEQLRVFESPAPGTRKVIVSTNIAEASVTIDGIRYVIDCGFVKVRLPLVVRQAISDVHSDKDIQSAYWTFFPLHYSNFSSLCHPTCRTCRAYFPGYMLSPLYVQCIFLACVNHTAGNLAYRSDITSRAT